MKTYQTSDKSIQEQNILYQQQLLKTLNKNNKPKNEIKASMSSDQPSNSLQTKSTIDEETSEALTTRSKHKGLQLYNTLKKRVPEMYWNDHGVVKINNQTLHGSNIIDIITFMMSDSKKSYPEGLKTIALYIYKEEKHSSITHTQF